MRKNKQIIGNCPICGQVISYTHGQTSGVDVVETRRKTVVLIHETCKIKLQKEK